MRRVLAGLILLAGSTATVVWLMERELRWPSGPPPFVIPEESSEREEVAVLPVRPVRVRPATAPDTAEPFPVTEPEGVERVVVRPGAVLRDEPQPGAATRVAFEKVAVLRVLDRAPGWVRVLYDGTEGWVPDPAWRGPEPVLGSAPDPVRPLTGRPPDEERLNHAREHLAQPGASSRLGPYPLYTDVRDPVRLAFLDRVAVALEDTYRDRYGVAPVGKAAEAVVLFASETGYRSFLDQDEALAGLPATGHMGYGIVSFYDGGRPEIEMGSTLIHELTHLLNRRAIGPALPSWLDEGIADDLSLSVIMASGRIVPGSLGGQTVRSGRRIDMHGARAALQSLIQAAGSGTLRPLPELLALEWDDFVRRRAEINYAESAFFIRYLLEGEQSALAAGFRDFLAAVAGGMPPEAEALRQRLDRPWPVLEAGFRLWLLAQREDRPLVP